MTRFQIIGKCAFLLTASIAFPATASTLVGTWSGDRINLTINAQGAVLEADCASGSIPGPLHLNTKGSFRAAGHYERFQPGPQHVDEGEGNLNASEFAGTIHGRTLALTITAPGTPPQHFTLTRGKPVKLVRCY